MMTNPSILVGIGGTGASVVRCVKNALRNRHGNTAFIVLDVDANLQSPRVDEDESYLSFSAPASSRNDDALLSKLGLDLMPSEQSDSTPLTTGRLFARAAFLRIADLFERRLSELLESVRGDSEENVNVYLVACLAGGTGSGMLLNAAQSVRRIGSREAFTNDNSQQPRGRTNVLAWLDADVYPTAVDQTAWANSYAALKELERSLAGSSSKSTADRKTFDHFTNLWAFDRLLLFAGSHDKAEMTHSWGAGKTRMMADILLAHLRAGSDSPLDDFETSDAPRADTRTSVEPDSFMEHVAAGRSDRFGVASFVEKYIRPPLVKEAIKAGRSVGLWRISSKHSGYVGPRDPEDCLLRLAGGRTKVRELLAKRIHPGLICITQLPMTPQTRPALVDRSADLLEPTLLACDDEIRTAAPSMTILDRRQDLSSEERLNISLRELSNAETLLKQSEGNEPLLRACGVILRLAVENQLLALLARRGVNLLAAPHHGSVSDILHTVFQHRLVTTVQQSELMKLFAIANDFAHHRTAVDSGEVAALLRNGRKLINELSDVGMHD